MSSMTALQRHLLALKMCAAHLEEKIRLEILEILLFANFRFLICNPRKIQNLAFLSV